MDTSLTDLYLYLYKDFLQLVIPWKEGPGSVQLYRLLNLRGEQVMEIA